MTDPRTSGGDAIVAARFRAAGRSWEFDETEWWIVVSPAAHSDRINALIEELKGKHGVDYEAHANYGFVEKPEA
jgi:hypothetical protein